MRLVESAKFPPVGKRLWESISNGPTGNVSQTEYLLRSNDSLLTIVQMETKETLENVSSAPPRGVK